MVDVTDIKDGPLEKEGWKRRSILDEPRLSEVVAMYREMGFEVIVVDLDPKLAEGCKGCIEQQPGRFRIVYTRKMKGAKGGDDLF